MGGSGGGAGPKPQVQYAEPLDYGALMNAASAAATAQVKQQYKSMIENYPALETLSLGTVDRISGRLGATPQPIYEMVEKKDKRGKVTGYEKVQTGMSEGNQQTADALARVRQGLAIADLSPDAANPTSIESELYRQGERDLALGRSLSPEQIRESQQAARGAFEARGMGTSLGSSAAEILNREASATQRERERQGFASAANDQYINNITNRRINLANMYYTGAGNLIAADPYSRALGPGLNYSGTTQGNQMSQIGSAFNSANQMAGNVASFNANMLDSRANSALNNWASMRAASIGANATRQAGMYGMIGGLGGGLLQGGGMAAFALSDKREKTDIKPLGTLSNVLKIPAYEYRYKGDNKKRHGVMAQDVKKVLPEAVAEVDYKGKKRLAIRPGVIGAALAQELTQAAA